MSNSELVHLLDNKEWHIDKYGILVELAERALGNEELLLSVWELIGNEIEIRSGLGTPLGAPAAAILVGNGSRPVLAALAESMSNWPERQQTDFFFSVYQKSDRKEAFDRLVSDFGFRPKIDVGDDGELPSLPAFE